jgi:hypothetical protein
MYELFQKTWSDQSGNENSFLRNLIPINPLLDIICLQ